MQYRNGERYEVSMNFSSLHCCVVSQDCSAQGQWKSNLANGHGTLNYADGDKYVGNWKDGKKSGYGELIYTNGDKFSGNWLEDKASGMGKLEYSNGDIYDGQWERDQRHGKQYLQAYID